MNEKNTEQSQNGVEASASIKEKKIIAEDLLSEIELLLKDYFVGMVEKTDGALAIRFLNGQKFKLSVEEIN